MIRILIADDHAVVREGLKRIIADTGDMMVAAEAVDGRELMSHVAKGTFDALLMDLSMPESSGLDMLHEIRRRNPRLPILVLTMYPEDQYAVRAITAGASGYLHKGGDPDEIITALRKVVRGQRFISPQVAEQLARHVDRASPRLPHDRLSNREFEVLCLIGKGKSPGDIARELSLSVKTISTFRRRLAEKLGLRGNADIVRYAIKHGLVD